MPQAPLRPKPRGSIGSWSANFDGESLPCVHKEYFKALHYNDPGLLLDEPKHKEFVALIRKKMKVILPNDEILEELDRGHAFRRVDYIAAYTVADIEFDEKGLRFRFVDKIAQF